MAYRIAIGTLDGEEITEHFGRGKGFQIVEIDQQTNEVKNLGQIEVVNTENCGNGHDSNLIQEKIQAFLEWNVAVILVKQIGPKSERMVTKNGMEVLVFNGRVEEAMEKVKIFYKHYSFVKLNGE